MRSSYQCGKLCDAVGVSVDEEESERFGLFFLADNGTQAAYHPDVLNQYEETGHGSVHEVSLYQNVSYHYLGDTRLARVSLSPAGLVYELGYDALGRCVRRTSNGVSTYYIYDGERPIIEFDAVGTITARNTYGMGMDEILARDSGTPLYYHQDRLGNVSAVTNGVGQVVEQYRYDAFGQPEIRGGPVPGNANGALTGTAGNNVTQVNNRFLFNGREWAAAYGFYEYRNRAYNPALGRFMSEDPMGFKAGDRNLFRYCGGDPVNRMDPMGTIDTWSRLMLWQGGGDGTVSEQVARIEQQQQQASQAAGNDGLTMGQISAERIATPSRTKSSQERAVGMLAEETKQVEADQTGVITKEPPYRAGPVSGKKVERYPGHSEFGYKDQALEQFKYRGTPAYFVHYHSHGGRYGLPTDNRDLRMIKEAPMYFSNRDWAREGKYEILRFGRQPEIHFDPRIVPDE